MTATIPQGEALRPVPIPSVDSTVALDAACSTTWDAIVVGAGPAGAFTAYLTAKQGARTLLVDRSRFPRAKVCGGCFNARTVRLLAKVGLADLLPSCQAVPTREAALAMGGRSLRLPMSGGYALSRETFDAALVREAIAAGAEFLSGARVRTSFVEDAVRRVEIAADDERAVASARIVVAADGLGGRLTEGRPAPPRAASRLGGGVLLRDDQAAYAPGTVYMAGHRDGYVGVVRVEQGLLNVAAAFDPSAVREKGLGSLAADICESACLPPIQGLRDAAWQGTPLLTRRAESVAGERILAVGDATGYVEPFTGEGMAWALAAALAAAPLVVRGSRDWSGRIPEEWQRAHRDLVVRRAWLCRTMTGLLRWPLATRTALAAATMFPAAARLPLHWLDRLPPALDPIADA